MSGFEFDTVYANIKGLNLQNKGFKFALLSKTDDSFLWGKKYCKHYYIIVNLLVSLIYKTDYAAEIDPQ